MAWEASSRTGGTWFSVMMWLGMAGEFGIKAASWTSRSNIWLPAGDESLGDEETPYPGDEGIVWFDALVWIVDRRVGGCFVNLFVELAVLVTGSCRDEAFADSSVFFLPSPNSPRILFFFSKALVSCLTPSPAAPARTLSLFCGGVGSKGSAKVGTGCFDEPLCSGTVAAILVCD